MNRLLIVGAILVAGGLAVAGVAFLYGVPTADAGLDSAQAMYEAQGVELAYQDGRLVDRGSPETAAAILRMLEEDWAYPVKASSFDPGDPLVNTRDELMYQYAVIIYHVIHGEVQVTLTSEQVPLTYRGIDYTEPGTYPIEVGASYAQLDRTHPVEGQLRNAWTPLALSLTSFLVAGHANQATGELAWFTSMGVGGVGVLVAVAGAGLMWASLPARARPTGHAAEPTARAAARAAEGHAGAHGPAAEDAAGHTSGGPDAQERADPARRPPRPARDVPEVLRRP